MKKIVNIVYIMVAVALIISTSNEAKADDDGNICEVGIATVKEYSAWSDLNDLKSTLDIGDDVHSEFSNAKSWKVGFHRRSNGVTESLFKGKSLGGSDNKYADNVDILFYAGHGLKPGGHGAKDYCFALNTYGKKTMAKQADMKLGNRDLEWLVTFTCNFLHGGLSKVGRIAKGVHSVCGYKTDMTITANSGKVFCSKLKKGISVKEAYFAYANSTQAKLHKNVAAVFTTKKCANDRIWGYGSVAKDPVSYSKDSSNYVCYYYNCY